MEIKKCKVCPELRSCCHKDLKVSSSEEQECDQDIKISIVSICGGDERGCFTFSVSFVASVYSATCLERRGGGGNSVGLLDASKSDTLVL